MDAGVAVTAVRYDGMIHDFVLLNALQKTPETQAALKQASGAILDALQPVRSNRVEARRVPAGN
jgi:acetyl esterase/lipase